MKPKKKSTRTTTTQTRTQITPENTGTKTSFPQNLTTDYEIAIISEYRQYLDNHLEYLDKHMNWLTQELKTFTV